MRDKIVLLILLLALNTACKKEINSTYERFFFRTEGADIAVEINGNIASNTFILLLHGGPGGGSIAYNNGMYSKLLEDKYAIVYMDQRGNGASQGAYNKSDLTLNQNSKDVYALTLFLKQKYGNNISLFLMGHSWGGMTSAHALINTPLQEELNGWIEIDGAHDFTQNNIETYRFFIEMGKKEIAKKNEEDFWNEIIERLSEMDTANFTNKDKYFLNSKGFEAEDKLAEINKPAKYTAASFGLINSPNLSLASFISNIFINPIYNKDSDLNPLTNELHKIKIPSQILWGKYDFVVSAKLGYTAFDLIGSFNKELYIFEHSGHSPMLNEPELFVAKVINFIEIYK